MSVLRFAARSVALTAVALSASAADIAGIAQTTLQTSATDPSLVNPWGLASSATSPFWVANNGSGTATLYNTAGTKQGLVVSMPVGSTQVTGQVFNGGANFNGDSFLFATENGTINGWRGALGTTAQEFFSVANADYTGLAINAPRDNLMAANFAAGTVDVFNNSGLIGTFADPNAPSGYAPFNVQNLGGKIYVTFAERGAGGDPAVGAGKGFVDVFDPSTHTFTRVIS